MLLRVAAPGCVATLLFHPKTLFLIVKYMKDRNCSIFHEKCCELTGIHAAKSPTRTACDWLLLRQKVSQRNNQRRPSTYEVHANTVSSAATERTSIIVLCLRNNLSFAVLNSRAGIEATIVNLV